MNDNIIGIHVL